MPRVTHFEIHAGDPQRAMAFYEGVFGWEFNAFPGDLEYWLVRTGEEGEPGIDGGLIRRQGPEPVEGQAVLAYVCTVMVPSVDDYAGRVTEQGGSLAVPKMAIPGVGWVAYARDTEGNILGLWQADASAGSGG